MGSSDISGLTFYLGESDILLGSIPNDPSHTLTGKIGETSFCRKDFWLVYN